MPDSRDAAFDPSLEPQRAAMADLLMRHVDDKRVVDAMLAVPREAFVPAHLRRHAYDDSALPIGEGQTISQPLIVAMMLEALSLRPSDRVLEVGTGSGYVAALLAQLAGEVVTVERVRALLDQARARLAAVGASAVETHEAADVLGWPERAPYDAIVVSAAAEHVPRALIDQLAAGGHMVLPVGPRQMQELVRVTKTSHGVELVRLGACAFVPLIDEETSPRPQHDGASATTGAM